MARKPERRPQLSLWEAFEEPPVAAGDTLPPGAGHPATRAAGRSYVAGPTVWRYPGDPAGTGRDMVTRCANTFPELGGLQCLLRTVDVYCDTCAKMPRCRP